MLPTEQEREEISLKPRPQDDPRFAAGRIAFAQYIIVAVFVFLLAGFWELQIGNPGFYSERAEKNRDQSSSHPRGSRQNSRPRWKNYCRQSLLLQPHPLA